MASLEAIARPRGQEPTPSTSTPHVQPSDNNGVPMKTIQIGADAAQTTLIAGGPGQQVGTHARRLSLG
jgi:hypothetical protein